MIDCGHVIDRLWDYLDGELPADEAREITAHLAECGRCFPQYRFQFAFLAALARHRDSVPLPSRASIERLKRVIGV